jgi:hypothetical protein
MVIRAVISSFRNPAVNSPPFSIGSGECLYLRSLSPQTQLIRHLRAYLTSKGEAFSAWDAFLHDDWNDGVHEPSPTALILLASYEKLGRPDLAECVRRGTKYKMLQGLTSMDYDVQSVEELNDLRRAFLEIPDGQAEDEPKTNLEWDTRAIERYQDDERLQDLLKRYPLSGDQAVTSE